MKLTNKNIQIRINKYKNNKAKAVVSDEPIKGTRIRRKINPILINLLHIKSKLMGLTYENISNKSGNNEKTVIYAITHIGKFDYEMVVEALGLCAYPFAGDWELMYATVDDYFLRTNGVLYIDTSDKEDRQNSFKYMCKLLKQGTSMVIFPEGIWNLSPSLPVHRLFPGCVQAAKECNVPIVPIAVEQVEKHFIVNVGDEIDVNDIEEAEAVQKLRDTLATLKWNIWEHIPHIRRSDIPPNYYEDLVDKRLSEFKGYTREVVNQRIFKTKAERELAEIERDLKNI